MKDWILLFPFPASDIAGENHKTLFVLLIFIFSCLHYGWKKSQGWLQMKHLCLKKEHFVPEPPLAQPYKVSLHNKVRAKVKQGKNWKEKEPDRSSSLIYESFCVVSIWFANNRFVSKIFLWLDVQFPEITMDVWMAFQEGILEYLTDWHGPQENSSVRGVHRAWSWALGVPSFFQDTNREA